MGIKPVNDEKGGMNTPAETKLSDDIRKISEINKSNRKLKISPKSGSFA